MPNYCHIFCLMVEILFNFEMKKSDEVPSGHLPQSEVNCSKLKAFLSRLFTFIAFLSKKYISRLLSSVGFLFLSTSFLAHQKLSPSSLGDSLPLISNSNVTAVLRANRCWDSKGEKRYSCECCLLAVGRPFQVCARIESGGEFELQGEAESSKFLSYKFSYCFILQHFHGICRFLSLIGSVPLIQAVRAGNIFKCSVNYKPYQWILVLS